VNIKPKVIILTGPCGVGKTTIAKILVERLEVELIDGDMIRKSLFPNADFITEHPDKLKIVKQHIFELSKKYFSENKSVLIDYVVLGEAYIAQYKKTFKEHLVIKVLLTDRKVIYERDENRKCWTSGRKMIDELHQKFKDLKGIIGQVNFIDNGNETPEETAKRILKSLVT